MARITLLCIALLLAACGGLSTAASGSGATLPPPNSGSAVSSPLTISSGQVMVGCVDPTTGQGSVTPATLFAYGGQPSDGYSWTLAPGSVYPAGATVHPLTGVFDNSGFAPLAGTYHFEMEVSDGVSLATGSIELDVSSSTTCGTALLQQLSSPQFALPAGVTGSAYGASLVVFGGTPPYTWALATGSLPAGLVLGQAGGVVYGTIAVGAAGPSPYSFTVNVTDKTGETAIFAPVYQITVP